MPLLPKVFDNWIKTNLFNAVPVAIGIMDQALNLIHANKAFEEMFGAWQGRKCFQVYKKRPSECKECRGIKTFQDGLTRISEETGYDKYGTVTRFIKHTLPIIDQEGDIPFIIEMSSDITESERIRREYQLLFEQVPCNILLINRDFRIVNTNTRVKSMLGDLEGSYCFKALKGFEQRCTECTAQKSFEDGNLHTGHHTWCTKDGDRVHQQVITVPLKNSSDDNFDVVLELAVDITQTIQLEQGLNFAHSFLETMIATSKDGIFATDEENNLAIFNPAAKNMFKVKDDQTLTQSELASMLPDGLFEQINTGLNRINLPDAYVKDTEDQKIPVRLVGNQLAMNDKILGMAFSIQDLSELKRLESENLEAERLAAVGQTVAGLAHGVKNLITALEGGRYMMSTGLQKGDVDRLQKGIEMIDRNIERIGIFVKTFLDFSKGRKIHAMITDPCEIAKDIVANYASKAEILGIRLEHKKIGKIEPAPLDFEGMHECLTNLVGNAIDACQVSETYSESFIQIVTSEKDDTIYFEVFDNGCGIDYDLRKKLFTTFFTTKGLGGTGIGLLMTKKIVQEHGGKIEVESEIGKNTVFRVILPRNRLPKANEHV
ncbi:MAG: PAS domain S-box protein [Deltaproteobacteria bacterium]|nr:PAS domain S-box protein [Deltaproteobacteria bacterium]